MSEHYRGYSIEHDPPPIPIRTCDWAWVHDDYGGPGDFRCGHSGSLAQAKADIDEQIADIEADEAPRIFWCADDSCEEDNCTRHPGPYRIGTHGDSGGVEREVKTVDEACAWCNVPGGHDMDAHNREGEDE